MSKAKLVKLIESDEIKSWRLLMSTFQCVYGQLEKGLAEKDVSVPRFQVLFYLYFEGRTSASALSRKLLVTRSNMSMFLKRMESDGLINFDFPTGQKRPEIELTARGSKFFEELFPEHAARVTQMVHPFAPQTIKDLEKIRRRVSIDP
ncbi:MAG: MarR family transcriptional regulator [Pseudobdellovibrio sp.]